MKDKDTGSGGHVPAGSDLQRWVATLVEDLGVDPDAVDIDVLLDLARDVAHGVGRPAVPLTSFLVGYAVGAGAGPGGAGDGGSGRARLEQGVARVTGLANAWEAGGAEPERTS